MKKITFTLLLICACLFSFGNAIKRQPHDTTVCQGVNTYFTILDTIHNPVYHWQHRNNNNWVLTGTNNDTLFLNNVSVGDTFRCYVDTLGPSFADTSTSAILIVNALPTPNITVAETSGTTSNDGIICNGATATLNVGNFTNYLWTTSATTQSIIVSPTTLTTYNVTVSNNNGCTGSGTRTITVNVNPTPAINASGATTFCLGGSVNLNVITTYTSYIWSTGETTQFKNNISASGTYRVTVTNVSGCTGIASQVVTVNPLPTATITPGGLTTFCQGGSVTLTSSVGISYLWLPGGAITPTLNVTSSGSYTVRVTDGNGCSATSSPTIVTVNPLPIATITPSGPTTFCQGGSVTLTSSASIGYLWSPGGASTISINVSTSGNYTVRLTDGNSCSATSSPTLITVNPLPTPSISIIGSTTFCSGQSVRLYAPGYSINSWNNSSITDTIIVTTGGTYIDTVTDIHGCRNTASQVVTVLQNPAPMITPTGPTVICQGGIVTLSVSTLFPTYSWCTGSSSQSINVANSGTYVVTITNSNGCTNTASQLITVNPNPHDTIYAGGPLTFCFGGSVTLNAGSYISYLWSNTFTTQIITTLNGGTFTVTVTDNNGCTGTASQIVTVNSNPNPVITTNGPTTFCQGSSVILSTGAFSSYHWSNGETTNSITVNSLGTYSVTVNGVGGCTASTSQIVTVNANPTPSIIPTGPTTFCSGDSIVFYLSNSDSLYHWSTGATTSTISVNTTGTYTVTVTKNNGCTATTSIPVTVNQTPIDSIIPSGLTTFCQGGSVTLNAGLYYSYHWSTNETSQTITENITGTFYVTVTTAQGCSGTAFKTVTVNPNPTPVIVPNGLTTFCDGDSLRLSLGSTYTVYTWTGGSTTPYIYVKTTNNYFVTVTNNFGCIGLDSQQITVNLKPAPVVTSSGNNSFCQGDHRTLSSSTGLNWKYFWSNGDTTQTIIVNQQGNYYVKVTDINGCVGVSTTIVILVHPLLKPTIDTVGGESFCEGVNHTLFVNYINSYNSFLWNNGGTNDSVQIQKSGIYRVTVTDINGCVGDTAIAYYTGQAASVGKLIVKSNNITTNILICKDCPDQKYKWGYEPKINPLDTEYFTCSDRPWCEYQNLDTLNNYYWVYYKTTTCFEKLYFNPPPNLRVASFEEVTDDIFVYPNPNNGIFYLKYHISSEQGKVNIFDMFGRILLSMKLSGTDGTQIIDASILGNGVYFWELVSSNELPKKGKVTISK